MSNKRKKVSNEYISSILYALLIAFVFRSFLFEAYKIPSSSMEPTLLIGDYLFVSKYSYGYSKYSFMPGIPIVDDLIEMGTSRLIKNRVLSSAPKRGDIIIFRGPKSDRISFIKRLIGLPGDTIIFLNNELYVNGQKVIQQETSTYNFLNGGNPKILQAFSEFLPNTKPHTIVKYQQAKKFDNTSDFVQRFDVPANHYFFMGDNRDFSGDSRFNEIGMVHEQYLIGRAEILFWTSKTFSDLLTFSIDPRWFERLKS